MSKYADNIERKTEVKRKESARREALGKYFFDLSKLTFAGLVLGVVIPLSNDLANASLKVLFFVGVYLVFLFGFLGNKMYKY